MCKRIIKLCRGCVEALNDYNPYVDDTGQTIPIEELQIVIVDKIQRCDNYKIVRRKK